MNSYSTQQNTVYRKNKNNVMNMKVTVHGTQNHEHKTYCTAAHYLDRIEKRKVMNKTNTKYSKNTEHTFAEKRRGY